VEIVTRDLLLEHGRAVLRLLLPPVAVSLALAPIVIHWGGTPRSVFTYLLYVFVFDLLPGTLLWLALTGGTPTRGAAAAGWVFGLCLEAVVYDGLDPLGLANLTRLLPLVAVVVWALAVARRRVAAPPPSWGDDLWPPLVAAIAVAMVGVAIDAFTPIINIHFAEQALAANAITHGVPYRYPMIDGMPVFYNYLIHSHMAAASRLTGISTLELSSRCVPLALLVMSLYSLARVGLVHYASRWVGLLVILQVFIVVGRDHLQADFLASTIPRSSVFVLSTLAAFAAFFATVSELEELTRAEGRKGWGRWLVMVVLLWASAGLRMPALACFGAGVATAAAWSLLRGRSARPLIVLTIVAGGVGALSLVHFYGALTPFAAPKFMTLVMNPSASMAEVSSVAVFERLGLGSYLAGLLAFVLVLCGQCTFLIPGIVWLCLRRELGRHPLDVFWLGVAAFGAVITYFSHADGGSHITFMHYTHLSLAFLGARGLVLLWSADRAQGSVRIAWAAVALLATGQAGEAVAAMARSSNWRAQGPPVLLEGEDYQRLTAYLRGGHDPGCRYVVDGFFRPWHGNILPAEVPGLQLLGTPEKIAMFLERNADPGLVRRREFLEAVGAEVRGGRPSPETLGALQERFDVPGCLVVVVGFGDPEDARRASGWDFNAGRFYVFRALTGRRMFTQDGPTP
jgi:hypothetical protein